MQTYWIVRDNGRIVAALKDDKCLSDRDRYYRLEDICSFAEIGPVERISTDYPITIGGTVENFVRPKA